MSEKQRKTFLREHIKKEIAGLVWMAIGIFLLLSLVSFNNNDPSFNNNLNPTSIHNFCGRVGARERAGAGCRFSTLKYCPHFRQLVEITRRDSACRCPQCGQATCTLSVFRAGIPWPR